MMKNYKDRWGKNEWEEEIFKGRRKRRRKDEGNIEGSEKKKCMSDIKEKGN